MKTLHAHCQRHGRLIVLLTIAAVADDTAIHMERVAFASTVDHTAMTAGLYNVSPIPMRGYNEQGSITTL
jgi:hypothetical protein